MVTDEISIKNRPYTNIQSGIIAEIVQDNVCNAETCLRQVQAFKFSFTWPTTTNWTRLFSSFATKENVSILKSWKVTIYPTPWHLKWKSWSCLNSSRRWAEPTRSYCRRRQARNPLSTGPDRTLEASWISLPTREPAKQGIYARIHCNAFRQNRHKRAFLRAAELRIDKKIQWQVLWASSRSLV